MVAKRYSRKMNAGLILSVCLVAFFFTPSAAYSSENEEFRVIGYLQHRSEFGLADAEYNPDGYTMGEFLMNMEINYDYSEKLNFHQIIRARYDGIYDWRNYFEDQSMAADELKNELELRELYLNYAPTYDLNFRIGKQVVIWGESDGLRLMDMINPLDLRWGYLTRDFEDTRTPLNMVRVNYNIPFLEDNFGGLELVWVPTQFEVNQYPIDGSAWAMAPPDFFNEQIQNILAAGLLPVVTDVKREQDKDNGQIGGKFTINEFGIDLSLNYFYGYAQDPVIYFAGMGAAPPPFIGSFNLKQEYPRRHIAGLTFNKDFGMIVARGEFAYTFDNQFQNLTKPDWVEESDYLKAMLGFDWRLRFPGFNKGRTILISGQYFLNHIMDYNDDIINLPYGYGVKEDEQIATLLMNTGFMSDTIFPEIFVAYDVSYQSWWINPKLKLEHGSYWRFELGANIFEGDDTQHVPFAMMDKADSAYVQIRRMF